MVQPHEELDLRGLYFLDVFPVIIGYDFKEGGGEAVAEAVNEEDAEDEGWVELGRKHL